jgi:transposase
MFSTIKVESHIRPDHRLRDLKRTVDGILKGLSPQFDVADRKTGRPGVPPERLLKALLLMTL